MKESVSVYHGLDDMKDMRPPKTNWQDQKSEKGQGVRERKRLGRRKELEDTK